MILAGWYFVMTFNLHPIQIGPFTSRQQCAMATKVAAQNGPFGTAPRVIVPCWKAK